MLKKRKISKGAKRGDRKKQRSGVKHKKDKMELQISTYITFKEIQCLLKKMKIA